MIHFLEIKILTVIFFMFTFLAATQDIAVDGWGLEILSKYLFIIHYCLNFKIKIKKITEKMLPWLPLVIIQAKQRVGSLEMLSF